MHMRRYSAFLCFATALACAGVAHAASPAHGKQVSSGDVRFAVPPVSDARLMKIRGGFDIGNGLLASFGISRLVYIDGNLVSHTSVNIPNMAHVTQAQLSALGTALGKVNIIRNGPGNHIAPTSIGKGLGATVIQNSLNNQQIRTATKINATVKDLGAFHRINLGNSLRSAVIKSRVH